MGLAYLFAVYDHGGARPHLARLLARSPSGPSPQNGARQPCSSSRDWSHPVAGVAHILCQRHTTHQ
eukprot:2061227-Prorocentrum_lima.AAC.1